MELSINLKIFRVKLKLEDLKVLGRSPDLFNNVKIGKGQLLHSFFNIYGVAAISIKWPKKMNTPPNRPVISEKPMFR